MRVTLDANILVYALQQGTSGTSRHRASSRARYRGDCIQTLQSFAECFNALVRKRKLPAGTARAKLDDLAHAPAGPAAAAPADLDRAIWATMTHRLAFWDAMLWATAERVGCSLLLTEDGHDGRSLRVYLRKPFRAAQPCPDRQRAAAAGALTMTDPIRFTLDGREVEALPAETIWQVAKREGVDIPHLCWLPEPGYRADGNCRACMVEVEGERVLAASCIRKPTAGMKVLHRHRAGAARPADGDGAAAGRPAGALRRA